MERNQTVGDIFQQLISDLASAASIAQSRSFSSFSSLSGSIITALSRLRWWAATVGVDCGVLKTAEGNDSLRKLLRHRMKAINICWQQVLQVILTESVDSLRQERYGPQDLFVKLKSVLLVAIMSL